MGCGKISRTNEAIIILRPLRSKEVKNEKMFIEDIDDANNETANKRKTIHMDMIQKTASMLQIAKTNNDKASVYNMKGDYYFLFANTLRRSRNLDYFVVYRKSMAMFKMAAEFDSRNIEAVMGITRCLVKLHQYKKAIEHLEKSSKHLNLLENEQFWTLMGICKLKRAQIWNGKSKLSKTSVNLKMSAECLNKAIKLKPDNEEILKEKKVVDNLVNTHSKYNGDVHKYIDWMKTNALTYDIVRTTHKSDKEFYKILSVNGGGMRYRPFEKF
jgi:tetratricopeptide (TPR) repeat protein